MPIITSSSRTWPVRYNSRLPQLPGNNFVGRTRRQSQDVLTHESPEWFKATRRGGLSGLDETSQGVVMTLEKVPGVFLPFVPWAKDNFEGMYSAVKTLANGIRQKNPQLSMDEAMKAAQMKFPKVWSLWVESGEMLRFLRDTPVVTREMVARIKSTGVVTDKDQRIASQIEPKLMELSNALTPNERKQVGLGFPPAIIYGIVIIASVIIAGVAVHNTWGSDPAEKAKSAKLAIDEINSSDASPAVKQAAINDIIRQLGKNPNPDTSGILKTIGWTAALLVGGFVFYTVFVKTGVVEHFGRAISTRFERSSPSPRPPSLALSGPRKSGRKKKRTT